MIYDLLEYFKDETEAERLAVDSYLMKNGLYFIYKDGRMQEPIRVTKDFINATDDHKWLKTADYLSCVASTNKCFDAPKKAFHNNNYFTLFFKCKTLVVDNNKSELFDSLRNLFYQKMRDKLLSKEFSTFGKLAKVDEVNVELLSHVQETFAQEIESVLQKVIELEGSDNEYIKLFFYHDINLYKQESKRYFYPYIFNNNDHNINLDGKTVGLSPANIAMNIKKPFMMHVTSNYYVPFRITLEDALRTKQLFEFLGNQRQKREYKGKEETYNLNEGVLDVRKTGSINRLVPVKEVRLVTSNLHYLHLERGTDIVIDEYEFLPGIDETVPKFRPINYLKLKHYDDADISSIHLFEEQVNKYLYEFKLKGNYKADSKDIKGLPKEFKSLLIYSRKAMENFFIKKDNRAVSHMVDELTQKIVKEKVGREENLSFYLTAVSLNMRLALLEYFSKGENELGSIVKDMWETIREKLIGDEPIPEFNSDQEYYFATGQLVRYLLIQSRADKPTHGLVESCLNARNDKRLKQEILKLYRKYNHAISLNYQKFNKLFSMVEGYNPDSEHVDADLFLSGLCMSNLLMEKKAEEEGQE